MLSVFIYVVKWMLNQFLGVQIQDVPKLAIKKNSDIEHGTTQIHKNRSASAGGDVELPISFLITQKIVKEKSVLQKSNNEEAHFDEIKNISDLEDVEIESNSTTESEESIYPKNCSGTPTTFSNCGSSDQWSLDLNEKKIERDSDDYDSGTYIQMKQFLQNILDR